MLLKHYFKGTIKSLRCILLRPGHKGLTHNISLVINSRLLLQSGHYVIFHLSAIALQCQCCALTVIFSSIRVQVLDESLWGETGEGGCQTRRRKIEGYDAVFESVCWRGSWLWWWGIALWLPLIAAHIQYGSNDSGFLCMCVVWVCVWVCAGFTSLRVQPGRALVLELRFIISREIPQPPLQSAHLRIRVH